MKCQQAKPRTFADVKQMVKLKEVYDGDTIKIITRLDAKETFRVYSLRIHGIDTPEIRTRNVLEKKAGQAAKQVAMHILGSKSLLWVEFTKEDKYGRLMGKLYLTESFTNCCHNKLIKGDLFADQMLHLKQAKPYFGKTKPKWTNQEYQTCVTKSQEFTSGGPPKQKV